MSLCGVLIGIFYLVFGLSLVAPMLIDEHYKRHKGSNAETKNEMDQMRKRNGNPKRKGARI